MPDPAPYNLALETAGPRGGVALGRGDRIIDTTELPAMRRQGAQLMPTLDTLVRRHGLTPRDLGHIYLDLGPGSFTGLRIAVATAKMLAMTLGVKLVGVDGLDVLAHAAPDDAQHVAVAVSAKRGTCYSAVYRRAEAGGAGGWERAVDPGLRTLEELLAVLPTPAVLIAPPGSFPAPGSSPGSDPSVLSGVTVLEAGTEGDPAVVYRLGHASAERGRFADPLGLTPIYAREPEAVTLWRQRAERPAS